MKIPPFSKENGGIFLINRDKKFSTGQAFTGVSLGEYNERKLSTGKRYPRAFVGPRARFHRYT